MAGRLAMSEADPAPFPGALARCTGNPQERKGLWYRTLAFLVLSGW
jgi:hypothetical protein